MVIRRAEWFLIAVVALAATPAASQHADWLRAGPIYETHPYYHGGTFRGLTENLPRIAELGVKTIYLMPVFKQPDGFPAEKAQHIRNVYRVPDFRVIDPVYGTPAELKALVAAAHRLKLRVLFDLVVNNAPEEGVVAKNRWVHTLPLAEIERRVQAAGKELTRTMVRGRPCIYYGHVSRGHADLYEIAGQVEGTQVLLMHFPRAGWGLAPDYANPQLIAYFSELAASYVRDFDIDGWRLDAPGDNWNPRLIRGDHSSVKLLGAVGQAIRKIKPDAVLFAETPSVARKTDPPPVLDEVCDASYGHYFLLGVSQGDALNRSSGDYVAWLQKEPIEHERLRAHFLETHDTPRAATWTGANARALAVLMATGPGVPMIQAGQEIGATERYGPTLSVDWAHGDEDLWRFYQRLFAIRSRNACLQRGAIADVWRSGDKLLAYVRKLANEQAIVVVNPGDAPAKAELTLTLPIGTKLHDALGDGDYPVDDPQRFTVELPAHGARILLLSAEGKIPSNH